MNGIETHLRMIQLEASDFGGVQEVPATRVGEQYRYSNPRRVKGVVDESLQSDFGTNENNAEISKSIERIVGLETDSHGRTWLLVEDNS